MQLSKSYIAASLSKSNIPTLTRIVISVCAGRCETEMQANPSDLCICLDIDKRSLFAAAFVGKYLQNKKNNLFHHFDMGKNLLELITNIRAACLLPIDILFQHPSPSLDTKSRNVIACAATDCMSALMSEIISSVHFVFDQHETGTSWTYESLRHCCFSRNKAKQMKNSLLVSNVSCIANDDDLSVNHPLFGIVQKGGWAKMKRGKEMTYFITKR